MSVESDVAINYQKKFKEIKLMYREARSSLEWSRNYGVDIDTLEKIDLFMLQLKLNQKIRFLLKPPISNAESKRSPRINLANDPIRNLLNIDFSVVNKMQSHYERGTVQFSNFSTIFIHFLSFLSVGALATMKFVDRDDFFNDFQRKVKFQLFSDIEAENINSFLDALVRRLIFESSNLKPGSGQENQKYNGALNYLDDLRTQYPKLMVVAFDLSLDRQLSMPAQLSDIPLCRQQNADLLSQQNVNKQEVRVSVITLPSDEALEDGQVAQHWAFPQSTAPEQSTPLDPQSQDKDYNDASTSARKHINANRDPDAQEITYWLARKLQQYFIKMVNNGRHNQMTSPIVGHIAKLDCLRPSIHVLFFIDTSEVYDIDYLFHSIKKFWIDNVTNGLGIINESLIANSENLRTHQLRLPKKKSSQALIDDFQECALKFMTHSESYLALPLSDELRKANSIKNIFLRGELSPDYLESLRSKQEEKRKQRHQKRQAKALALADKVQREQSERNRLAQLRADSGVSSDSVSHNFQSSHPNSTL